jgi:hypothetical protein
MYAPLRLRRGGSSVSLVQRLVNGLGTKSKSNESGAVSEPGAIATGQMFKHRDDEVSTILNASLPIDASVARRYRSRF